MQSTSSEDTKFPPILNSDLIKKHQKTNLNNQVLITALGKNRKEVFSVILFRKDYS